MIAQNLDGKRIAITGSTGFVGTALVERLLRAVPGCELVLLIRPSKRHDATERARREIFKNNAFDRLRADLGKAEFDAMVERRVTAVGGDVSTDGLGLSDADRAVFASCDIVIHSAAAVSFDSPLDSAIERVLEVAVGAFTGLAVSFAVVPSRAHNIAVTAAARMLEQVAVALDALLKGLMRGLDTETLHRLQDDIGAAMTGLSAVGAEAEHERAAWIAVGPDTGPLLRTLLRLRHDLVMIGRVSGVKLPDHLQPRLQPALEQVRATAVAYVRGCEVALLAHEPPPSLEPFEAAQRAYADQIAAVRSEGLTHDLAGDVIERFFTVGFALEQLHQNFIDLRRCVATWSGARRTLLRRSAA